MLAVTNTSNITDCIFSAVGLKTADIRGCPGWIFRRMLPLDNSVRLSFRDSFIALNPGPIDFSPLGVPHHVLIEAFARCTQLRESLKQPCFPLTTVNISVSLWNLHSTQQQGGCTVEYNPSGSFPAITSTANSVWACESP